MYTIDKDTCTAIGPCAKWMLEKLTLMKNFKINSYGKWVVTNILEFDIIGDHMAGVYVAR